MKPKSGYIKRMIYALVVMMLLMNTVAFIHAYKFTHFTSSDTIKTANPEKLSFSKKLQALFLGVNNPRPKNKSLPESKYETVSLNSNKKIECWHIPVDSSKGTVIIFHGFSGYKSSMLDKSEIFNRLGHSTFLVDFMGSGGSEGNQTTIGYFEAQEVVTAFNYLQQKGEKNIILFGTSMGAAAIMKALNDSDLQAAAVILECPFGSMLETVQARFKTMKVPSFPMANLLVFWGGVQNNFNAFEHNPEAYSASIHVPALLLYGEKDRNVSRQEIDRIFANLKGKKELKLYPESGHENYLIKYKEDWIKDVTHFLTN